MTDVKGTPMLDDAARVSRYQAQTGRTALTPRQQRRVNHKRGHQSQEALFRRDRVIRDRIFAAAERARRRAASLPAA
jgi:hypothetical protein